MGRTKKGGMNMEKCWAQSNQRGSIKSGLQRDTSTRCRWSFWLKFGCQIQAQRDTSTRCRWSVWLKFGYQIQVQRDTSTRCRWSLWSTVGYQLQVQSDASTKCRWSAFTECCRRRLNDAGGRGRSLGHVGRNRIRGVLSNLGSNATPARGVGGRFG